MPTFFLILLMAAGCFGFFGVLADTCLWLVGLVRTGIRTPYFVCPVSPSSFISEPTSAWGEGYGFLVLGDDLARSRVSRQLQQRDDWFCSLCGVPFWAGEWWVLLHAPRPLGVVAIFVAVS